jgi:hypothetical protein
VHVRQRAETLLTNNHYDPESVREIADGVTSRWQQLVTRAEERHKLVTASLNFYKTAEQVQNLSCYKKEMSVLLIIIILCLLCFEYVSII